MISMILAMDINNLIGNNNELPWYYPEDLKYFKQVTVGKAVFMGYNTYLSIVDRLGHALPKRDNYVLTYEDSLIGGGIVVKDMKKLFAEFQEKDLFIIGGKSIYEITLDLVDRVYLTRINKAYNGNVYLMNFDLTKFRLLSQNINGDLSFEVYERII